MARRVRPTRPSADVRRRLADALIDGAPVGMGMVDTSLRFIRVNPLLADMNGHPAEDHLGRRPGEVEPAAGELFEPILERVRDTGEALLDHPLSAVVPGVGERHWLANYYPVTDAGAEVVGVGCTVQDVTGDVVSRRRSARLLEVAQGLAGVVDEESLNATVAGFLAREFGARCALAHRDGDRLVYRGPAMGYPDEVSDAWAGVTLDLDLPSPLCRAVREAAVVAAGSWHEQEERFPEVVAINRVIGDEAVVCVPITHPGAGGVQGVIRLAWTAEHPLTDTTRTFCETVASMASLALERIRLATDLEQDRFRGALDAMLDDVTIGRAVRDASGAIVDFRLEFMSDGSTDGAGRGAADLVGRRVLECFPAWRESGQFDIFRDVVESGAPWVADRFPYRDTLDDGTAIEGFWNIQVVRFGDGYLAAFRDVTEVVALEESERAARAAAEREQAAIDLLQRAALPQSLPQVPGVGLGARYQPAGTSGAVGGDWYDAFTLRDGRLALVIADVAGHGSDAAAFMVQVRNVLRAMAVEHVEPGAVLCRANSVVTTFDEPGGPFVTCCYAVLDPATGDLRWASAGHLPPVLVTGGVAALAEQVPDLPLAVDGAAGYRVQQARLAPGDRLVLYTDGLVERRGELIDDGLDRLVRQVGRCDGEGPVDTAAALGASVEAPFDDLAVLVVDLGRGPGRGARPD